MAWLKISVHWSMAAYQNDRLGWCKNLMSDTPHCYEHNYCMYRAFWIPFTKNSMYEVVSQLMVVMLCCYRCVQNQLERSLLSLFINILLKVKPLDTEIGTVHKAPNMVCFHAHIHTHTHTCTNEHELSGHTSSIVKTNKQLCALAGEEQMHYGIIFSSLLCPFSPQTIQLDYY